MDSSGFSTRLASLIGEAAGRAVKSGHRVLVSLSERIPMRDPLAALEACYRSIASEMQLADHVSAGMAYWARPSQGFAIAAFGAAAVLSPTGHDRFAVVDDEWRWLLSNALIESDSVEAPGVGPILIGGFSFDADGPYSDRWRGFPSAHLIVPQVHLTNVHGESWLTVSTLVGENGNTANSLETLLEYRDAFTAGLHSPKLNGSTPIHVSDDLPEMEWRTIVGDAVEEIRAGDLRKVVLARSVHGSAAKPVNAFQVLRRLDETHTDALVFGYWRGRRVFVGASPERLAQLDGREISASSLAGTVRRGDTPEEDALLAAELESSEKDLVEHAAVREMLVEILAEVGENVSAPDSPGILTLSNVHHLHTEVRAELCDDYSLLDVISRLHPTPAVGGTPRARALDFIREKEQLDRGWYAAPVGWLDAHRGEFAVALRSGIIEGDEFALYAGCGIVADSDPEEELAESILKLEPMRLAIAGDTDT